MDNKSIDETKKEFEKEMEKEQEEYDSESSQERIETLQRHRKLHKRGFIPTRTEFKWDSWPTRTPDNSGSDQPNGISPGPSRVPSDSSWTSDESDSLYEEHSQQLGSDSDYDSESQISDDSPDSE